MKGRMVRLAGAVAVVGAAATSGFVGASPASADTSLIGWTAQANANVFDLVVDNSSGLAGSHPLSEIDVPEDMSDYETGPLGHGLATMVWPGAVAGNIGSLSGEAGLPSQLSPITSKLNDPFRAESFYPAGPTTATYPPGSSTNGAIEMTSHADANETWAKAALADVVVPGLFDLRGVQGASTATATSAAQSTASGAFQSLSLMGGAIQIGATTSSASAQSDGTSPSGTSTTHLGAVTIAGQKVSIGSDGIVVGPASTGLSGLLSAAPTTQVDQVISALHLKIVPLPQSETSQAPAEQISSGGLQISFSLPSNLSLSLNCTALPSQLAQLGTLCTLPGLLQGLSFTLTIGRVSAEAIAAQPFALGVEQAALGPLPGSTGTGIGASPIDLGSTPTAASPSSAGAPVPSQSLKKTAPIALSSPIGVGLLVALLAVAAALGLGLRRMTGLVGASALAQCPDEEVP